MMKTTALAFVATAIGGAASANAQTAEPSSNLPDITVYPNPVALLIDRLSRQIIDDMDTAARLPALSHQEARATDVDGSNAQTTPSTRDA